MRTFVLLLICLLLSGLWAFAVHHHDDGDVDGGIECQFCQYGAQSEASLPVMGFIPIPFVVEYIEDNSPETICLAIHSRAHDARAPPFVS